MNASKASVKSIFDSIAENGSWANLYAAEANRLSYGFITRKRAVEELVKPFSKGSVLDLGCGTGELAAFFLQSGADYTGVDFSSEMIKCAKRNFQHETNSGKVNFLVEDCENLSFSNAQFNTVVAMGLIEYFEDPNKVLDEIKRIVLPGGYVLITVPHRKCINFLIRRLISPFRNMFYPIYIKWKKAPLVQMREVKHHHYNPAEIDKKLISRDFRKLSEKFANFYLVPHPLDHIFPNLYIKFSEWASRPGRESLFQIFAANYIAIYQRT